MDVSMHAHKGEDRLRVNAEIVAPHDDLQKPYSRVTIHGADGDVVTLYGFCPADLSVAGQVLIVHAAQLGARIAAGMEGAKSTEGGVKD